MAHLSIHKQSTGEYFNWPIMGGGVITPSDHKVANATCVKTMRMKNTEIFQRKNQIIIFCTVLSKAKVLK